MKCIITLRSPFSLVLISLAISFLLFYDFGKSHSLLIDEMLNYGHLFLFGFIAIGICLLIQKGTDLTRSSSSYVRAGIITILLGVLTECIQGVFTERSFELSDILNNSIGSIAFLSLAFSFREPIKRKLKIFLWTGALSLIIISAYPVFEAFLDSLAMHREFPLISSFESEREMKRWAYEMCTFQRTRSHATLGEYSLRVDLQPGEYPGITQNYIANDWRGYRHCQWA